jgi:hypothetical protein
LKLIEPLAWVFVDLGFAQADKSCGLLAGDGKPKEISFSQLRTEVMEIVAACGKPLNLLIEAPLSVAFIKGCIIV